MRTIETWDLTKKEWNKLHRPDEAVYSHLMLPLSRLQELEAADLSLDADEIVHVIIGLTDLAQGLLPHALFDFEQLLLPTASARGERWRLCVLLWCASCRIYTCDADAALAHIAEAEKTEDLADSVPEFMIVKGMALRLLGRLEEAAETLRSALENQYVFPEGCSLARGWLYETEALLGHHADDEQRASWLVHEDRLCYGTMGILPAALYRIRGLSIKNGGSGSQDDILERLDGMPVFQRPVIMTILSDVLPRPLAGVCPKEKETESYWGW